MKRGYVGFGVPTRIIPHALLATVLQLKASQSIPLACTYVLIPLSYPGLGCLVAIRPGYEDVLIHINDLYR